MVASIVVVGGGICGSAAALLLARDGHDVTVLERDPAPLPATAAEAWDAWDRASVAQFRQPHTIHPGGHLLLEAELPELRPLREEAGCVWFDSLSCMPPFIADRAPRPGDERFLTLTGRRPALELAFAWAVARARGIEVRRGVTVAGLLTGPSAVKGVPHVTGVRTDSGEELRADLVVDASGRRSALPRWLETLGARPPHEEAEDAGFTYLSRFFASTDGTTPAPMAGLVTEMGSISLLTLPGDNDTWSATVFTSSNDAALRRLREPDRFDALWAAAPLHAHWVSGKPLTDVVTMSGTIDRYRRLVVDGAPVVTGIVAVADACMSTNPSLGRGITYGLRHVTMLRDVVREAQYDPAELARAWDARTEAELAPCYRATVTVDRARLADMDAARAGTPAAHDPSDPGQAFMAAVMTALVHDPDIFRAFLEIQLCLAEADDVFARPGLVDRVMAVAADHEPMPAPGPDRAQLLALLA